MRYHWWNNKLIEQGKKKHNATKPNGNASCNCVCVFN